MTGGGRYAVTRRGVATTYLSGAALDQVDQAQANPGLLLLSNLTVSTIGRRARAAMSMNQPRTS